MVKGATEGVDTNGESSGRKISYSTEVNSSFYPKAEVQVWPWRKHQHPRKTGWISRRTLSTTAAAPNGKKAALAASSAEGGDAPLRSPQSSHLWATAPSLSCTEAPAWHSRARLLPNLRIPPDLQTPSHTDLEASHSHATGSFSWSLKWENNPYLSRLLSEMLRAGTSGPRIQYALSQWQPLLLRILFTPIIDLHCIHSRVCLSGLQISVRAYRETEAAKLMKPSPMAHSHAGQSPQTAAIAVMGIAQAPTYRTWGNQPE